MRLIEIYSNATKPVISFEVFPPKGEGIEYQQRVENLLLELTKLKKYKPSLISVTYGAGGSTREKTFDLVLKIKNELEIETMPHFTCVNFDKVQILDYVQKLESKGIKNILALRGDPPKGTEIFVAPENGFSHANELVEFIRSNTDLSVAVAGYPEKHPEAVSFQIDLFNLKRKITQGADVVFTQLFFDNNDFFKFYENLLNLNVNVPIIPGIMVVQSISQIDKIISLSGSKIPKDYLELLYKYKEDSEYIKQLGIEYAAKQVKQLIEYGVKGLHFYPLNKAYAVSSVLEMI